jgi:hypothetical protein
VKAGIRDRTKEYIVSENSWPLFLYENYTVDRDNLEKNLFKSKLLVQVSGLGLQLRRFSHCTVGLQSHLHITFLREGS